MIDSRVQYELLSAMLAATGRGECPIDPRRNTKEFIDHYGLEFDGRRFDWSPDGYPHMVPVYEDEHPQQTIMAGAQTGKSARVMAGMTRAAYARYGALFGYYFPDYHLPKAFSRTRFAPFVRGHPELAETLGADRKGGGKGTDNVLNRTLGETNIFFLSVAGKTATEGLPMQAVFFDEVRRMAQGDIERAMERYSAQINPIDWKVSTARYPESDIHRYFLQGDQRFMHSGCSCLDGCVLPLTWPECVADLRTATPQLLRKVEHAFTLAGMPDYGWRDAEDARKYPRAAWHCPKCGDWIPRPTAGWWEPHAASHYAHSWHISQILTPTFSAGRMLKKSEDMQDIQEFWNSGLGLPYLDENQMEITKEDLYACVDPELRWPATMSAEWRKRNVKNTCMGVDVQAGYLVVVIKVVAPSGKYRTIHLEVIASEETDRDSEVWKRLAKMIYRWDVRCCVVDQAPDFTAARNFAKNFRGRVFTASYDGSQPTSGTKLARWGDTKQPKSQRGKDLKFRYGVTISKIAAMKWSLKRWRNRANEIPDPRGLVVTIPKINGKPVLSPYLRRGTPAPTLICEELYFDHLLRMIFRNAYDDGSAEMVDVHRRRGEVRIVAEHIGIDPHFLHASLYADVACGRVGRPA